MRSANETPEQVQWDENGLNIEAAVKPVKQRLLPLWMRSRLKGYGRSYSSYDEKKTIKKIKSYIEKHRHHPEYLNALESKETHSGSILRWACFHHVTEILELLLSCDGVDVNNSVGTHAMVLHDALWHIYNNPKYKIPYVNEVMMLLNYPGTDATSRMKLRGGEYPLIYALKAGEIDIAKKILEHNGHTQDSLSDALKIAVEKGYSEFVTLLLQKNVVVTESHLIQAMDADDADIVEALLNYQPFVVNPRDKNLVEALTRAAEKNNYSIVKLFVDRKLDIGVVLLPWAASQGHFDIVKTILARDDFDANTVFKDKHNYLTTLIKTSCPVTALRLLECRKEVRVNDHVACGDTALILAAGLHQKAVVANLLARSDIEIDAQNDVGDTALHWAAKTDNLSGVTDLLRHHANPNIQNKEGETPLIIAIKGGCTECVTELLANTNTDITLINIYGKTALMYAAEKGMKEVVEQLLLRDDSNVNLQDAHGDTALILAARAHDDANIIEALLAHGADDGIKNERSHTALMVAEVHHRSLCPLLNGYVANRYQYQNLPAPSAPPLSVEPSAPPFEETKTQYDPGFFAPHVANGEAEKSVRAELKR